MRLTAITFASSMLVVGLTSASHASTLIGECVAACTPNADESIGATTSSDTFTRTPPLTCTTEEVTQVSVAVAGPAEGYDSFIYVSAGVDTTGAKDQAECEALAFGVRFEKGAGSDICGYEDVVPPVTYHGSWQDIFGKGPVCILAGVSSPELTAGTYIVRSWATQVDGSYGSTTTEAYTTKDPSS